MKRTDSHSRLFDRRVKQEDITLFDQVESILSDRDKRSLLAIQSAIRDRHKRYVYLEIGSYKGGSLQPHLLDPRCERIISIDKRVLIEPDERGETNYYVTNTTEMMTTALTKHFGPHMPKLTTIEADASEVDAKTISPKPDLFLIDAEHTDRAVTSDFGFCVSVMKPTSVFLFHDTQMIFGGMEQCCKMLQKKGIAYYAYTLPTVVGVIEPVGAHIHDHPQVLTHLANTLDSYLYGMKQMDLYRMAYKRYFQNSLVSFTLRLMGKLTAKDLKSLRKID